ncbi:GNAT family N-acetyltransferase [Adhaeretor mobilis]|uniref:N-acetyltransferase domain-containing protein n=1 Tax=Adhaeretor mobilis TaxID=1930276 RepID=A0A517MTB9_9BACT|nr:GNAT family N-acetyltransferase [Adhaeretor mobilis]QDS98128.1 hypothetical protein HG15A2_14000 [Adhaeretor mobilis]
MTSEDPIRIETLLADDIDEPLARSVSELLCRVWPKPGRTVETRVEQFLAERGVYQGPPEQAPRSFLIREGSKPIAFSSILSRTIRTEAGRMTIAGLAKVCTDPEQRGHGLGEKIVRAALAPIDDGSFPLVLFQTDVSVQPFYEKLGSRRVENRIVNSLADDPEADAFWHPVIMIYPKEAQWPEGTIDLQGPGY